MHDITWENPFWSCCGVGSEGGVGGEGGEGGEGSEDGEGGEGVVCQWKCLLGT